MSNKTVTLPFDEYEILQQYRNNSAKIEVIINHSRGDMYFSHHNVDVGDINTLSDILIKYIDANYTQKIRQLESEIEVLKAPKQNFFQKLFSKWEKEK